MIENGNIEEAIGEVMELVLAARRAAAGARHDADRAGDSGSARSASEARFCLCESYARVTERAALAGARWLGRADHESAEEDASTAMRAGARAAADRRQHRDRRRRDDGQLAAGETLGAGGLEVDLALDPLEGRGVVARGGNGAMSMVAVGEPGSFLTLPDMYMRKMAVGPQARGAIDLASRSATTSTRSPTPSGACVNDVTTIVLDRPRHHDLIEEIRDTGARIKLIQDGDVTASISAAIRGTNDHLAIGIGGTRQAVLSAAALRCLGGELQAQLWPTSRREIEAAREAGHRGPRADLHDRRPRARRGDRRRDRRLERRPPARRPLPRRQRTDALARDVHALQLGALRRRDPLLRPRAARGSPRCSASLTVLWGRCRRVTTYWRR